jgi:hypothetical protein
MRTIITCALALASALIVASASAQVAGVDLNGRYQCVEVCLGPLGDFAVITQNGWEFSIVTDAGVAFKGWVDYPRRIWIDRANQGAMYAPDGLQIQFDSGTIWLRIR